MKQNKKKRASGIYRLEPMFQDPEKTSVTVKDKTFFIDGNLSGYLIVSVSEATTRASALELERSLSEITKKPVLIVTHNMSFLRATLLTGQEKAKLSKIIKESIKSEDRNASPIA